MTARRAGLLALTLLAGLLRLLPLTAGPATGLDAAEHRTLVWLDRSWPLVGGAPPTPRSDPPRAAALVGRAIAATASAAAVPIAFSLAQSLGGTWAGITAGALLAVNPTAVRAGKTLSLDALLLPLALLALGSLMRSRATTATLVALPLGAALVVGLHAAAEPIEHLADLPTASGEVGAIVPAVDVSGASWLLGHALPDALGLDTATALAVALCWIGLPGRRRSAQRLAPAAGLAAGAIVAAASLPAPRFADLLPALAGLAPAAGLGVANVIAMGSLWNPLRRAATVAFALGLVAALVIPGLIRSVKLDRLLARPDTRTLAAAWLSQHAAPGDTIALVRPDLPWGKPRLPTNSSATALRADETAADLRARGVRWLVIESSPGLPAFTPAIPSALERSLGDTGFAPAFDAEPVKPGSPPPRFDPGEPLFAPVRHVASVTRPGPRVRIWCVAAPADCR